MVKPLVEMAKEIDVGGIFNMVKEREFDLDTLIDLKDMAFDFLEQKGVPSECNISAIVL